MLRPSRLCKSSNAINQKSICAQKGKRKRKATDTDTETNQNQNLKNADVRGTWNGDHSLSYVRHASSPALHHVPRHWRPSAASRPQAAYPHRRANAAATVRRPAVRGPDAAAAHPPRPAAGPTNPLTIPAPRRWTASPTVATGSTAAPHRTPTLSHPRCVAASPAPPHPWRTRATRSRCLPRCRSQIHLPPLPRRTPPPSSLHAQTPLPIGMAL